MKETTQKKIAAINDLSGYGRCALTVAIPVISHMKIQCCPVPTSILSNHTGYEEYFFDDYSERLPEYLAMWKKLGLTFDGIMSGFLGSRVQIGIVETFIRQFAGRSTKVVVDPVMGDHGKIADTYTEEMCLEMRRLVALADIITPNLTEACRLTDTPYREEGWSGQELFAMARALGDMGPKQIVITGIPRGEDIVNFVYEREKEPSFISVHRVGDERCGTGDLFAAIVASDAVNGAPFDKSVAKASDFVRRSMLKSMEMRIDRKNGVCFEELLDTLTVERG